VLACGKVNAESQQFSLARELAKASGYVDNEEAILKTVEYGR